MSKKLLIPLAVFVVLCGFLLVGLWRDPREVPSPLIGKPAPAFVLAQLRERLVGLALARCRFFKFREFFDRLNPGTCAESRQHGLLHGQVQFSMPLFILRLLVIPQERGPLLLSGTGRNQSGSQPIREVLDYQRNRLTE